jgi:hypothetical protein
MFGIIQSKKGGKTRVLKKREEEMFIQYVKKKLGSYHIHIVEV